MRLILEVPEDLLSVSVRADPSAVEQILFLFRPFCKSARDAANSAPGVGLGLSLSRRLARSMGGNLRLDAIVRDGAAFVLELPCSPEAA